MRAENEGCTENEGQGSFTESWAIKALTPAHGIGCKTCIACMVVYYELLTGGDLKTESLLTLSLDTLLTFL